MFVFTSMLLLSSYVVMDLHSYLEADHVTAEHVTLNYHIITMCHLVCLSPSPPK